MPAANQSRSLRSSRILVLLAALCAACSNVAASHEFQSRSIVSLIGRSAEAKASQAKILLARISHETLSAASDDIRLLIEQLISAAEWTPAAPDAQTENIAPAQASGPPHCPDLGAFAARPPPARA